MTFAIYIVLILGVFVGILNVLPSATALSFSFESSVIVIVGYMKAWDFMFPIHELFIFLALFITFELIIWGWIVSWKVVKFLRGHSDG